MSLLSAHAFFLNSVMMDECLELSSAVLHRSNVELLGVIKGETPDLDTIQKVHFGSELLGVIKGETPDLDAKLLRNRKMSGQT